MIYSFFLGNDFCLRFEAMLLLPGSVLLFQLPVLPALAYLNAL